MLQLHIHWNGMALVCPDSGLIPIKGITLLVVSPDNFLQQPHVKFPCLCYSCNKPLPSHAHPRKCQLFPACAGVSNLKICLRLQYPFRISSFLSRTYSMPKGIPDFPMYRKSLSYYRRFPFTSITTYSALQPVLNWMAQLEMPEVTIKFVPPRCSKP